MTGAITLATALTIAGAVTVALWRVTYRWFNETDHAHTRRSER